MAMTIVNRRGTVDGKPCIVWAKEHGPDGLYDCYIDGDRTVDGRPRHDLWHPSRVVVLDAIAVRSSADVPW